MSHAHLSKTSLIKWVSSHSASLPHSHSHSHVSYSRSDLWRGWKPIHHVIWCQLPLGLLCASKCPFLPVAELTAVAHQVTGLWTYGHYKWYVSWPSGFPQLASDPSQVNQSVPLTPQSSHASSAPSASGDTRIRRSDLSSEDRVNVDRACDLLILEIIATIGWNATPDQLEAMGQECHSQACADTNYHVFFLLISIGQ